MNVLFLLRLWPVYGGGETVTICLANEMVKNGWDVTIAYFKNSVEKVSIPIDSRIQTLKIENVNCDEFVADRSSSAKIQETVIKFIIDYNVNIVINQWWPVYYINRLKSETSAKIITCLHQAFFTPIFDDKGVKGRIKKMFSPIYTNYIKKKATNQVLSFLPYVDKYVFLSPLFQRQFIEISNYKGNKLHAIPNPLVYNEYLSESELIDKENIVLLVGRMLESQKRISRALRIWRLIENDKSLDNWRFVVVGEGPDLYLYKEYAQKLDLCRISFEGYQIPLKYYKKAKIFMMTSAFEGFPMTLVEAQQCGVVPVVMDSYLSLHDIVKDGFNGLISKNGDLYEFAKKISDLMKNSQYLHDLSVNAIDSSKNFCVKNIFNEWKELCYE